jgi:hypothetical protein
LFAESRNLGYDGRMDKRGQRVDAHRFEQAGALLLQPGRVLGGAANFFIWIRRNPLKSPDSAKGIQGNASLFPWIPLDFLAFPCSKFARQVVSAGRRLTVLERPGAPDRRGRRGDLQLEV